MLSIRILICYLVLLIYQSKIIIGKNLSSIIRSNHFVLVNFFNMSCSSCISYNSSINMLKTIYAQNMEKISFFNIDVNNEEAENLLINNQVEGIPCLILFCEGFAVKYRQFNNNFSEMREFVERHLENQSTYIESIEQFMEIKKKLHIFVLYGGNNESWNTYITVAHDFEQIIFFHTSRELMKKLTGINITLVLFKDYDEQENHLTTEFSYIELFNFIKKYSYPLVTEFKGEIIDQALILFYKGTNLLSYYDYEYEFKNSAVKSGRFIKYMTLNVSEEANIQFLNDIKFYDVYKSLPIIEIVQFRSKFSRFRFNSTCSSEEISNFIWSFYEDELEQFYHSEEEPLENNDTVKIIVGKTWKNFYPNNEKDLLVYFYNPENEIFNLFDHSYKLIAKAFSNQIQFGKIDWTKNEIPNMVIHQDPTLKLYKFNTSPSSIEYQGLFDINSVSNFLVKNGYDARENDDL